MFLQVERKPREQDMTPAAAWLLLVGFGMGWVVHGLPWWLGLRRRRKMIRSSLAPQPPGSLEARVMLARGIITARPVNGPADTAYMGGRYVA